MGGNAEPERGDLASLVTGVFVDLARKSRLESSAREGTHEKGPENRRSRLVEDQSHLRNLWTLGKIVGIQGRAPIVRSVQLLMPNGRIWGRPVNKICTLEAGPDPRAEIVEDAEIGGGDLPS